ncbi:hypothetical protein PoB_006399600 [Plakobranchus ocellatus]|uniref:Uncharacterized protein n=1 Tax=Plakobranchus ocellatus TaxID=259542 RepID=A0AAV4D096_9GAST|nr:hypothetical protein PoB_006399600 [Plakobranchus ocellatus]
MSKALRTKVPMLRKLLQTKRKHIGKFKETDTWEKFQQKYNFLRQHQARPSSQLQPGQPVRLTQLKHHVVKEQTKQTNGGRSYILDIPMEQHRRYRIHTRERDGNAPNRNKVASPAVDSTLLQRKEMIND